LHTNILTIYPFISLTMYQIYNLLSQIIYNFSMLNYQKGLSDRMTLHIAKSQE